MKSFLKKILNSPIFFFAVVLSVFLYLRGPQIMNSFSLEGKKVESNLMVRTINGDKIDLSSPTQKALVFWATWCKPCEVELSRINKMIEKNDIGADRIIAISTGEDETLVREETRKRGYKFQVGVDPLGEYASLFKVYGTPTIIVLDADQKIAWATMGISPLLEMNLKRHLK